MKLNILLPALKRLPLQRRGFALLVSLSAVVLLTILILAFFSRAMLNRQISFSSTNQIKADMLSRSAIEIIAGQMRQEILDAVATPSVNDGYIPSTQGVVNPDTEVGAYTIAKNCGNAAVVAPGGLPMGSSISVSQSSLNGRRKSNWFSSGPGLGSADLPTWAYMTRSNGVKIPALADARDPAKDDFVVGRFTYTVYDTSGMLDANVAGYPTTLPFATPAANSGTKASTTYADLSVLGMTSTEVDQLVSWRSAALVASSATAAEKIKIYDEWATGIPRTSGTPNTEALTAARSGHLDLAAGDNAFFSRRELLRFAQAKGLPDGFATSLTHFSRAVNVPSWGPSNVATSTIAYGDDADKPVSANRYFPNVTADGMTIRYYHDDGTYESEWLDDGTPLVTQRFSLAKLAWLGHDGPNTAAFASSLSATERERAIKTCFGLAWDAAKKRWNYSHGNIHSILTLDQVRQQKRQPDFFELLKAGILSGSLGGQPGQIAEDVAAANNSAGYWEGPIGRHYEAYSAEKDRHLLQIGANIIDQADPDNYPIAIYLDLLTQGGFSVTENEFNNTVFGLENLPMLQRIGLINHLVADGTNPGPMGMWIQPEFWNPNNSATVGSGTNDATYPTPSSLRLVTYGKCYVWNSREDPSQAALSTPVDFGDDYSNPKQDGMICFKNPVKASTQPPAFFNYPVGLTGGEASLSDNYSDTTSASGPRNRYPVGVSWVGSNGKFLGVFVGEVHRDPRDAPLGSPQYEVRAIPDPSLTFVVEYYDGSSWRPYSMLNRIETVHPNAGGSGSRAGQAGWGSYDGHVDPRTDRFSGSAGRVGAGQNSTWNRGRSVRANDSATVGTNSTTGRNPIFQAWPRAVAGFIHSALANGELSSNVGGSYLFDDWIMNLAAPFETNPLSRFRYRDPDAIIRPGDGWRGDITSGDGMLTYQYKISGTNTVYLPTSADRRRPVILNRPFRTVGELGYVFRDQPFKSLDFWSPQSADGGLLDLFCASEEISSVRAGLINPNAATPLVLQAMLNGATKQAGDATKAIVPAESLAVANAIIGELSSNGPLSNPAELVGRLAGTIYTAFSGAAINTPTDKQIKNKGYGETPVRALSASLNSRTWNLLIDVAAQSGRIGLQANGLEDFIVEGEKRYWLHLAVDRITGEVVDRQLEPYYE